MLSVLGVLADDRTGTLWVCSSDLSAAGVKVTEGKGPVALKSFDLKSGAPKASIPLPGNRTLCNDMVTANDGTLYVTDSFSPHILRLKPDAKQFEVWAEDPRFVVKDGAGLDGIAIGADGNVYTNTFNGGGLFRIEMRQDGSAGTVTQLMTSRKLVLPDGLRTHGNKLLMIEGEGRLDLVSVDGDKASIEVIKDGYKAPVSVTKVGQTLWVLEGQLPHLFDPKTGELDPFQATSITAPPQ
jgi:sugar lactone lactonase YvrE